jgi:hypothetical protein
VAVGACFDDAAFLKDLTAHKCRGGAIPGDQLDIALDNEGLDFAVE